MSRILIVEDEASLGDALRRGLREERHAVDLIADGADGLVAIETGGYDLIILDIMLPGLDGLEICRRVRARRQTVPILLLTARDATDDVVRGLDAGASDYLRKPFAFAELLARVRALLRTASGQSAELRLGPLRLDTIAHRAFCDGAELQLTAKEYQLLEGLLLNQGRVLSKERLTELLWDWHSEPDNAANAIEVYVSSLRRKLEPGGAHDLLRTVRGRGYVLDGESP